jgi:hypothetical protein
MPVPGESVRLLVGPAGIGKTRLASEFARVLTLEGATTVAWGHCWDGGGAPPYWPWTQVVRSLLDTASGTDLAHLVLAEPAGADRFELFDGVAAVVAAAATTQPVIVVLDDLHDADGPSLLLTRFVARQLQHERVLIVATHRPVDAGERPEVAEHLAVLGRMGCGLALPGLDLTDVASMLEDPRRAAQVHAVTGGNPLHVTQVRSAAADPRADEADPAEGLRQAVRARIEALDASTRAVVHAAAVLGTRFNIEDLTNLVGRGDVERMLGVVDGQDLVTVVASGQGSFAHPLLAEVALLTLDVDHRYDLHRRAASLMVDDARRIGELAHHLLRAGPEARGDAIAACVRGAASASVALAHEDAAGLYRQALDAIVGSDSFGEQRLKLLLGLGETCWRSGQLAASDAAYEEAWEVASALGDPASLARAALRSGIRYYFTEGEASPWLDRSRAALEAQPPGATVTKALLLADLSTRHVTTDHAEEGQRLAAEALSLAREMGSPLAIGSALVAQQVSALGPSTLQRRIRAAHEILACAEEADDYRLKIHGRFLAMGALLERGDIRALDVELSTLHGLVDDLGEPRYTRFVSWFQCTRALFAGDAAQAERIAETCLSASQLVGDPDGLRVYGGQLGVARWLQGRILEMEGVFASMRSEDPAEALWPATLAWIWADQGQLDAARGALATLPDLRSVPETMHWLLTMAATGDAAATVGTDEQVESVWSQLVPYADRMVPIAMGAATWGTVAKPLGRLALRLGRIDDGLAHLEAAVSICAQLGARPWLIDAQLELASALARHRPGDERTEPLLSEATSAARHLGLQAMLDRAKALAASEPSIATQRARPVPLGDATTPRRKAPQVNVLGTFEVVAPDGTVARWSPARRASCSRSS